jgi:hypothetical protein
VAVIALTLLEFAECSFFLSVKGHCDITYDTLIQGNGTNAAYQDARREKLNADAVWDAAEKAWEDAEGPEKG